MKRLVLITNFILITMLICYSIFTLNVATIYTFAGSDEPVRQGNTNSNNASLMINVYWGNEYIPAMLDVLDKYNIKTTFFIGGTWANKYPELLELIYTRGHELGNHGFFHKDCDKLSAEQLVEEISSTHNLVKSIVGYDMNLFAPPSGAYNTSTIQVCKNLGYKAILWTYDTIDWRDKDTQLIVKRATKNICSGNLILMHPTQNTLDALPQIINSYLNAKINLTTVSNTI